MSQSDSKNSMRVLSAANIHHDASIDPGVIWRFFSGANPSGCCKIFQIKRKYPVVTNSEFDEGSNTATKQRKKRKRRGGCFTLQSDNTREAIRGEENCATMQSCSKIKLKPKKKRHNRSVKSRRLRESLLMDLLKQKDDPFTDGFPMGYSAKPLSSFMAEGIIPHPSKMSRSSNGAANDMLIEDSRSNDRIARNVSASDTAVDLKETLLREGSLVFDFGCIQPLDLISYRELLLCSATQQPVLSEAILCTVTECGQTSRYPVGRAKSAKCGDRVRVRECPLNLNRTDSSAAGRGGSEEEYWVHLCDVEEVRLYSQGRVALREKEQEGELVHPTQDAALTSISLSTETPTAESPSPPSPSPSISISGSQDMHHSTMTWNTFSPVPTTNDQLYDRDCQEGDGQDGNIPSLSADLNTSVQKAKRTRRKIRRAGKECTLPPSVFSSPPRSLDPNAMHDNTSFHVAASASSSVTRSGDDGRYGDDDDAGVWAAQCCLDVRNTTQRALPPSPSPAHLPLHADDAPSAASSYADLFSDMLSSRRSQMVPD